MAYTLFPPHMIEILTEKLIAFNYRAHLEAQPAAVAATRSTRATPNRKTGKNRKHISGAARKTLRRNKEQQATEAAKGGIREHGK